MYYGITVIHRYKALPGGTVKSSKITSKYQATIPKAVRDLLKLRAGDTVIFEIVDGKTIIVKKATPLDLQYLKSIQNTLTEWNSAYDEEDYEHLQDI